MNDKDTLGQLRKIFGLEDSAPDAALIAEASRCATVAAEVKAKAEEESAISRLVTDSCGALNREQAREVIKRRSTFSPSQRAKGKPSK
jgi:hypothetical protein